MDIFGKSWQSIATYSVGIVDFFRLPLIVGSIAKDRDGTVAGPTGQHLTYISFKKMLKKVEGGCSAS